MISREEAHRQGILHRTAHVWIVREKDGGFDVLLQKRSKNKESFPSMYDTSSAGHIPAGEKPLASALRELEEELGITADENCLTYIGRFRIKYEKTFHGKLFRDNEITDVYLYREPVDISELRLQASEVEEVRWFDLADVQKEIQVSRKRFCVPAEGLELLARHLGADIE